MGNEIPVHCRVLAIGAFSAHADQNGLIKFIATAAQGGRLKKCFVVQGEEDAAKALAARASTELSVDAIVPEIGQAFDL